MRTETLIEMASLKGIDMLQWSRPHLRTETYWGRFTVTQSGETLQWSRPHLRTETTALRRWMLWDDRLQWSRPHLRTETSNVRVLAAASVRFNGAVLI